MSSSRAPVKASPSCPGAIFEANASAKTARYSEVCHDFRVMLELDGDVPLEGSSSGDQIVNLSPSMRYKLPGGLDVGLAVGFPITDMEHFQMRIVSSLLYEF